MAAVKGFQNENYLTVDGLFGFSSLETIESWAGTLYTDSRVPTHGQVRNGLDYFHSGDSGSAITTIRQLLNSKGYTCSTTGSFDANLTSVVKSFQTAMGLSADGYVGQGTLAVLEDTVSDTGWLASNRGNLTAGKLVRCGFTNILLRRDIVAKLNAEMVETDCGRSLVEYTLMIVDLSPADHTK